MKVHVSFTLDVDPDEWLGGPVKDAVDELVVQSEVQEHARLVVTDLYRDQGWLVAPSPV